MTTAITKVLSLADYIKLGDDAVAHDGQFTADLEGRDEHVAVRT